MKKLTTLILSLVLFQLPASTIIVNSVFDAERDPGAPSAAGFVEDGLMDSLFDWGMIMFSTYNASDHRVEGAKDARYMITIEPRNADSMVYWKLQATVNGMLIEDGAVKFSEIRGSGGLDKKKLYYLIGEEVAAKVSLYF